MSSHQSPRRRRTRQHALVAVEGDERARADHARRPRPRTRACQPLLEQAALEQERARDVVGGALDRHRVALARASTTRPRPPGPRRARSASPAPIARQQRAVADQVRVAADRRREVAVALRAQAVVAEVARRVVRLLERAQHERRERRAAVPAAAHLASTRCAASLTSSPACCGRQVVGRAAASGTSSDVELRRAAARRAAGPAARARGTARAACASPAAPATASLAAIIRNSISRCDSVCSDGSRRLDVPVAREAELRLDWTRRPARRAASRAVGQRLRDLARRGQRPRPRLPRPLDAREDPVHARVVEPLVGADDRAVERGPPDLRALELELDGHRQPVLARAPASTRGWTAPRAASARPGRARRPSSRAGTPRGRAPSPA